MPLVRVRAWASGRAGGGLAEGEREEAPGTYQRRVDVTGRQLCPLDTL